MRVRYFIKIVGTLIAIATLGSMVLVLWWHSGVQSALMIAGVILCASLLASAAIVCFWMHDTRAKTIVQNWAAEHGYVVLQVEYPFHTRAFCFLTTGRGQVVYCVTIRDGAGSERKAWVRCGSYLGSVLFSDEIEVKWQDEPKAA